LRDGKEMDSGFVMYPGGHARNTTADLNGILNHKFNLLGRLALSESDLKKTLDKLENIENLDNEEMMSLYNCRIRYAEKSVDELAFDPTQTRH
jgi:2-methylcitrate dehydratase